MDSHSGEESALPSDIPDDSILKNVCESSDGIENGSAALNDETPVFETSESVGACNDVLPNIEKNEPDMENDNSGTVNEETTKMECEITSESVSDSHPLQSTTLCDGENGVHKESDISSTDKMAPVTEQMDEENGVSNERNTGSSKTSIIMLDDEEDEEERHERFLRIDSVEKPFGDGRNEAGEKMSALKRRMNKGDNSSSTSCTTTSSAVTPPKNARLVFRNLPVNYTTDQIKELLQAKLPSGVLLGEFPAIIEGRAVVEVTPSNTAEQAARILHDMMIGDGKISVRKLITVDTADTVPAPAALSARIEVVQATCDREGCLSLVMQGDVHTQCCSHSICFTSGVFDPASCPHCTSIHARASAGELAARRLWRNRMQRMRKKRMQWVSDEVRLRFPPPDAPPRANAVTDAAVPEQSTGIGTSAASSTVTPDVVTLDDGNPVVVEGGDDAAATPVRVRDRSAERARRAVEVAELGSQVVTSKLEMQRRSKGKEYKVTLNNMAYGFSLKEVLEMLQTAAGPVVYMMPRLSSLVVEFETTEAATLCQQRLDKTTFMTRKISVSMHGDSTRGQQQQTASTSPTTGEPSSSTLKDKVTGDAVEPAPLADGAKLSAELQARLSTATAAGAPSDSFVGPVAPTSVKDRLVMPGASADNFGFSSELLESLNITLPIVKELSVSNLNERATSADVRELFNVAGCVMGVQYDRVRGTAVVEMRHPVEAVQAISLLHAQFYHNKPLTVRLHRANDVLPQGGTTPPFPKGLQTIGKRLPIDKKVMAALQAGLTTPVQPTRQRQQKMNSVEKRLQNNAPVPAKRPLMGAAPVQRNMNGSTPVVPYQNIASMSRQQNNFMGQQQKIIPTTMLPNAARPIGPQGSGAGGGAPFIAQKQDHARGPVGQNQNLNQNNKRGNKRIKRQSGSESDFGNASKRKNPYWSNYNRGPNATGNNPINSVANNGNFQNSAQGSGSKFSSNYGHGNNTGNNSNYGTLNRYTSSSSSNSTPMGQQYSGSGTNSDWNTGNSSSWNDNYSNWNWQQQPTNAGNTAAYGATGSTSSSNTAAASYGGTASTGYTDNTSAGGYGGANSSYAAGAVRSYSNTTSNNIAPSSYGSSSSSVPAAGYGGSVGHATASYGSTASTGYGVDASSASYGNAAPGGGAYSGSSGAYGSGGAYYNSSGAPEAASTAGAQPTTAWEGQPTAKVPKYNSDGSFAGFS